MKRVSLILLTCAAVAALTLRPAAAEPSLTVGSKAPALDIEHYLQEDDPRVTDFQDGSVYVVEFWATWCGPCIASMPHLADLQNKYRNEGVQIVSISNEPLDEVEAKMQESYPGKEVSFAEVTAPYTLTTDPDMSSHKAYMEAAEQRGIPSSFLVGKTGLIEWIGHPAELDEPLAAVVDGSWDREAFKKKMEQKQRFEEAIQQFAQLAGRGEYEQARTLLEEQLASVEDEELKSRWQMVRHQFNLMTGEGTQEDYAFYREQLASRRGNPAAVYQLAMALYGMVQNGGDIGPLTGEVVKALEQEVATVEQANIKAAIQEAIARLYSVDDKLEQAIAAQEQAVAMSQDLSRSQQKRMELFLSELKSKAEEGSEGEAGPNQQ
jgi:thiol-disulfide isomerase/thioredoxin